MGAGIFHKTVSLNGSGAGSDTIIVHGLILAIRILPSSGTPAVTIADAVDDMLDGVTISGDTTHHPRSSDVLNDGSTLAGNSPYHSGGRLTITVTGGAVSGSVDVWIKAI